MTAVMQPHAQAPSWLHDHQQGHRGHVCTTSGPNDRDIGLGVGSFGPRWPWMTLRLESVREDSATTRHLRGQDDPRGGGSGAGEDLSRWGLDGFGGLRSRRVSTHPSRLRSKPGDARGKGAREFDFLLPSCGSRAGTWPSALLAARGVVETTVFHRIHRLLPCHDPLRAPGLPRSSRGPLKSVREGLAIERQDIDPLTNIGARHASRWLG